MESPNHVPRWTPTPSPSPPRTPVRKPLHHQIDHDFETDSFVSDQEPGGSLNFGNYSRQEQLPVSTKATNVGMKNTSVPPPIPFLGAIEAPSLRVDSGITGFSEMERVDHVMSLPKEEDTYEEISNYSYNVHMMKSKNSAGNGMNRYLTEQAAVLPIIVDKNIESLSYNSNHDTKSKVNNGIHLTWKDLWVNVPDQKNGGRRSILQGLTGYVEPGQVLAIMGPSGCGKSTLLDTLAGRLDSNTRQTGEILVNGRKQALAFGTSAYVTQDDTLMTTLTVREAIYYSAQLQLPDSMSKLEKKERAESTIKDMGLQEAMNTRIGGWSVKGLSGGQKRRVSICIELLTRPKLLFLDEPTSGLDSAASYHVMSRIIKLAEQDRRTVIASIHQPSSEVFELFHNLCLLSSGRTIYFGPTSAANEYFSVNGFPCPPMRNPSDHFLRTINKDFDKEIEQDLEGGSKTAAKAIDILVKSYKSSEVSQQVQQRVLQICQQNGDSLEKKGSQASFLTQCLVLTRRSFTNMYRDLGYYWLRFAIYIALCLCVGTIYYDIGSNYGSIQARGSMLMFVAAFLTFMAIGGFPSFVEDMKIFTRERLNGHYGVGAFVIGNTVSSIPYLIMISLIPGAIAYYLVGLQKGIDHFLYFSLMLFACMMLVESLMMIVASIVPDFLMGIITGAGIQGVMMLNGGFFRLPNDLPKPFWKYPMYYIAFHKYANQGFYKNEFQGLSFPNEQVNGPSILTGDYILRNFWQVEMGYSKWIDIAVVFGMVFLYRFMFLAIIKMAEKVKPMIRALLARPHKPVVHVEDPVQS